MIMRCSGGSRGGPGGPAPPHYCWTKLRSGRRAEKIVLGDHPPISKGLFDSPPPRPLSQGSSSVPRTLFSFLIERVDYLKLPLIIPGLIHFSLIISERTYNRNRKRTSKQAIAMMIVIYLQCDNQTASSLLFFFAKLLQEKPKQASGEASCREKRGRLVSIPI